MGRPHKGKGKSGEGGEINWEGSSLLREVAYGIRRCLRARGPDHSQGPGMNGLESLHQVKVRHETRW